MGEVSFPGCPRIKVIGCNDQRVTKTGKCSTSRKSPTADETDSVKKRSREMVQSCFIAIDVDEGGKDRKHSQRGSNDPRPIPNEKWGIRVHSYTCQTRKATYVFLLDLGLGENKDTKSERKLR